MESKDQPLGLRAEWRKVAGGTGRKNAGDPAQYRNQTHGPPGPGGPYSTGCSGLWWSWGRGRPQGTPFTVVVPLGQLAVSGLGGKALGPRPPALQSCRELASFFCCVASIPWIIASPACSAANTVGVHWLRGGEELPGALTSLQAGTAGLRAHLLFLSLTVGWTVQGRWPVGWASGLVFQPAHILASGNSTWFCWVPLSHLLVHLVHVKSDPPRSRPGPSGHCLLRPQGIDEGWSCDPSQATQGQRNHTPRTFLQGICIPFSAGDAEAI